MLNKIRINSALFFTFILIILVIILPYSAVGNPASPSGTEVIPDTGPRLTGHTSWINSVSLSPTGETLVTGSLGGAVKFWDTETGSELHSIHDSIEHATSFLFSPDGSVLAAGRDDGNIELRNSTTGDLIRRLRNDFTTTFSLAFSPDGTRLASGHRSGDVHLWEIETGNHLKELKPQQRNVFGLSFSPDGNRLVTAGYGGSVKIWDPATAEEIATLSFDTNPINVISFSPQGRYLVWGGWNGKIVARDMGVDPPHNRTFPESASDIVETIRFYPGGERMVSGSRNGTVKIWNLKTGRSFRSIKNNRWSVYSMILTPDGIIMGGIDQTTGGYDGIISRWPISFESLP